ncbi:hypothetical protein E8E11_012026 [Didymella keratinophila]|nr:hypothetical protein E8E11_012026 [Didymella keratinophila]
MRLLGPCCATRFNKSVLSSYAGIEERMTIPIQRHSGDGIIDSGSQPRLDLRGHRHPWTNSDDVSPLMVEDAPWEYYTEADAFRSSEEDPIRATIASSSYERPPFDITMLDLTPDAIAETAYTPQQAEEGISQHGTGQGGNSRWSFTLDDLCSQEDIKTTDARDVNGVAQCPHCEKKFTGRYGKGNVRRRGTGPGPVYMPAL